MPGVAAMTCFVSILTMDEGCIILVVVRTRWMIGANPSLLFYRVPPLCCWRHMRMHDPLIHHELFLHQQHVGRLVDGKSGRWSLRFVNRANMSFGKR